MRTPIAWDLFGDRGIAFADTIPIVGTDFTGAAFSGQVRMYPDAPGTTPLVTLAVTLDYGGTDTVANHISAGRLNPAIKDYVNPATGTRYADSDSIALSLLALSATAAEMSTAPTGAIPAAAPAVSSVALAYDVLIDPSGGSALDKWLYGTFTVRGTVTQ